MPDWPGYVLLPTSVQCILRKDAGMKRALRENDPRGSTTRFPSMGGVTEQRVAPDLSGWDRGGLGDFGIILGGKFINA